MSNVLPLLPPVRLCQLRRLKWNERVVQGDFVEDGHQGYELWVGPGGFRADSFVKQIFRRLDSSRPTPK